MPDLIAKNTLVGSDDDLVTLLRDRKIVGEEALVQIEEIQDIITSFINQKNIAKNL